jgi:hypothetical protein
MSRRTVAPSANRHVALLARIACETRVVSPARFEHTDLGRRRVPGAGATDGSRALTRALADFIYGRYYLNDPRAVDVTSPSVSDAAPIALREDAEFGRSLREANAGTGYFDPGWRVVETPSAELETYIVRKGRLSLSARLDQLRPADRCEVTAGAIVAVRFPKDRPNAMPGFYAAIGSAGPPPREAPLVRWYFHLLPAGAPPLFARLTRGLDERGARFTIKALNDPTAYTRPDAAVLYLPRAAFDRTSPVVVAAHHSLRDAVRPDVPAFTRWVRPGLGLAEEPPQDDERTSFGQHRSRLIARGLVEAALRHRATAAGRLDAILATFASERISLDAPHLNPGSAEFEIPGTQCSGSR